MTYAEEAPKITYLTKRPTDRSDGRTVELSYVSDQKTNRPVRRLNGRTW